MSTNREATNAAPSNPEACRVTARLAVAFGLHLIAAVLAALALAAGGEPLGAALRSTAPAHTAKYFERKIGVDSWCPMLLAYQHRRTAPDARLYDVFFVERVKFQYPPSSLILFDLVPKSETAEVPDRPEGHPGPTLQAWLNRFSWAAALLTVLGAALVLEVRLAQLSPGVRVRWGGVTLRAILTACLGVTYYPLVRGYELGQIQVFLGCLATYAVLFHLLEREALSGACLGLCCLVKPQWGVILFWGVLRSRWRFVVALAGVVLIGTTVGLVRFGVADHLDYVRVLRAISGTGEAFWPNQSANGLANRVLGNGDPSWNSAKFAPPNPTVNAVTIGSSLAILALALVPWRRWAVAGPADLLLILTAATMASPVAWEHHYGTFLPLFAAALPGLTRARPLGRWTGPLLAASYLAVAGTVAYPPSFLVSRWSGLLVSHLYFGALVFFALLLRLRSAEGGVVAAAVEATPSRNIDPPRVAA
jgi:alpha-1,2-mannosyltransferase